MDNCCIKDNTQYTQQLQTLHKSHLVHDAQKGLHTHHVAHMGDGGHRNQKPLQFDAPVLNERGVMMVCELLQRLLRQGRKHISHVVTFHVLLDLRVELGELTEASTIK